MSVATIPSNHIAMRTLVPATFDALIEDLAFPPITHAGQSVAGAEGWAPLLRSATAQSRYDLLRSLADHLLAAPAGGRVRLRAWHAAGTPRPAPGATSDWLEEHLVLAGDRSAIGLVLRALEPLPDPVRHAVAMSAVFLAVGRDSDGWTSSSTFIDQHGRRRERVIVLGPHANVPTIQHECAHVWCSMPERKSAARQAVSTLGEIGLRALAERQGWVQRLDAHVAREERLVDAMVTAWC